MRAVRAVVAWTAAVARGATPEASRNGGVTRTETRPDDALTANTMTRALGVVGTDGALCGAGTTKVQWRAVAALGTHPVAGGAVRKTRAKTCTVHTVVTHAVARADVARAARAGNVATRAIVVGLALCAVRLGPESKNYVAVALAL